MATKEQIDLVLSTLSFYEYMTTERVIFDFDLEKVKKMKEFAKEDLDEILILLVKEKKVKRAKKGDKFEYIRIHPRKGWKKMLSYFKI